MKGKNPDTSPNVSDEELDARAAAKDLPYPAGPGAFAVELASIIMKLPPKKRAEQMLRT